MSNKNVIKTIICLLFLCCNAIGQTNLDNCNTIGFDDTDWKEVQTFGGLGTAPWTSLSATGDAAGLSGNSQWIWEPGTNATGSVPAGDWYFRKSFNIAAGKTIESAVNSKYEESTSISENYMIVKNEFDYDLISRKCNSFLMELFYAEFPNLKIFDNVLTELNNMKIQSNDELVDTLAKELEVLANSKFGDQL